jgi:DNA-3-methyladenine glycosylase II
MTQNDFAKQYAKLSPLQLAAIAELRASDKALRPWIDRIGPLAVPKLQRFAMLDALARSILYQQLNGRAAETIMGRLLALLGQDAFTAESLAGLSEAEFRSVGVSANKAKALQSLAQHQLAGLMPKPQKCSNAELIEALVPVRGIGPWTVQMLLIFRLGRPDVWPVDDFGVRKGVQIAHKLEGMPSAKNLTQMAQTLWHPQYSLAALYFWRVADFAKVTAAAK